MATYLVTGVAGFIGSKVAEFLLADGHTVVGIDNLNDAYDVRLKQWRLARLEGRSGFAFQRLDVCDREGLCALFDPSYASRDTQFDAVLNLAARAGVRQSLENPWVYIETNTNGTLNLLDLCRAFGVNKFVLASTSSLYGKDNPMPCREDADTNHPLSPYAASKKAAEALCYSYHYLYGIDVTVLRYFTVYGPAGRPDMMPFRLVQWISEERPVKVFGDGFQSRDFTYIDDIARGTIAGIKRVKYETINLGSDHPIALRDAIDMVEKLVGKKAHVQHQASQSADVTITWADNRKAKHLLHWQPSWTFSDGIKELIDWYQQNQYWAKHISTQ